MTEALRLLAEATSEFITRESICNGDVTRRQHGAADCGGIFRDNTTQVIAVRDTIMRRYDQELLEAPLWYARQRIVGPWAWQHHGTQRRDFRGVIDPLLSWRESIVRKRDRGGGKCRSKLQVPRQGGRAEAKEFHMTDVDGLLIKITESEGLRVNAGVLDQGTK
ncbi:hypothetical protein BHE74_00009540 [Ensete ventricosum]|nr:hypothetical protein GW17_00032324 [Ensete ventricosum]RWW82019.1 hypothetical protein BHE74_00009540 [Ensete ventricosum]RZR86266.1 hypothetical protein BHM03_00013436 [Ensete ventricosum]